MGNYYCKNCSVPLDYYNVDTNHHLRPSCRYKLREHGKNTYHEWRFFFCFLGPNP